MQVVSQNLKHCNRKQRDHHEHQDILCCVLTFVSVPQLFPQSIHSPLPPVVGISRCLRPAGNHLSPCRRRTAAPFPRGRLDHEATTRMTEIYGALPPGAAFPPGNIPPQLLSRLRTRLRVMPRLGLLNREIPGIYAITNLSGLRIRLRRCGEFSCEIVFTFSALICASSACFIGDQRDRTMAIESATFSRQGRHTHCASSAKRAPLNQSPFRSASKQV